MICFGLCLLVYYTHSPWAFYWNECLFQIIGVIKFRIILETTFIVVMKKDMISMLPWLMYTPIYKFVHLCVSLVTRVDSSPVMKTHESKVVDSISDQTTPCMAYSNSLNKLMTTNMVKWFQLIIITISLSITKFWSIYVQPITI